MGERRGMTEVLIAINSYLRGSTTPHASLGGYLTPFFRFIQRCPSYAGTAPTSLNGTFTILPNWARDPRKVPRWADQLLFSFFPCTLLPARFNRGEDWSDSGLAIVCIVVGAGGAMPCLRRKQVRRSEKFHKFFLLGRRVGNFEKKSKGVGE